MYRHTTLIFQQLSWLPLALDGSASKVGSTLKGKTLGLRELTPIEKGTQIKTGSVASPENQSKDFGRIWMIGRRLESCWRFCLK